MFKFIGGVLLGAFVGALVLEIIKRQRPELLESVEKGARAVSDRLFETLTGDGDERDAPA